MTSTKVIFTYKRKRLSSCSGVGHVEVCPNYTSNFEVDKCQNATEGRSENREQDLKFLNCVNFGNVDNLANSKSCLETCNIQCAESCFKRTCHAEKLSHTCSSPPVHKLSISQENDSCQDSDATHTRETALNSYELSGDRAVKTSCENILMKLGDIRNPVTKDVNSFSPHVGSQVLGTSVTQSEQKDSASLCKQNHLCDSEHVKTVKTRMTAPLLTFSRRLKKKVDQNIFSELPVEEGSATIKEGKSMGTYTYTYTCEITSSQDKSLKESLDSNARNYLETRNVLWPSKDEMDSRETTESLRPCSGSCSETLKNTSSEKDLNVDMSSVTTPTVTKTLGSNPSLSPNVDEVMNSLKENVRCSSNDGTVLPFCEVTDKTDDHLVSHQLQASDGESQLTSNSLDLKIATKIAEQKAYSGSFVIDCNAIPEPDLQDKESDTVLCLSMMFKSYGDSMEEEHIKTQGLEGVGSHGVLQLPEDTGASVEGESKPKIKCLELFSEDVKKDTEVGCSKAKQNVIFAPGSEKDWLERSSNGSAFPGLSLPTEPLLGQSSKHGFMPSSQDQNVRTREFIQNPPVQPSFCDHATSLAFRHRKLLESINTKTTALRRNRNISLVNFEPWTEEELDSLWIGIRRHGRGNWHAMLVDPRLHFAPWRAPRDLGFQWEQEQVKLLSGKHMIQDRYLNPPGPYNVECGVGFLCSGTGLLREKISADTQLSLGDAYTQKACSYLRSSRQSVGFKHRINPREVESHYYGMFDNFQIGDRPETGLATNNIVPHWLRGMHIASSRPVEPPLSLKSTLPQMEAHQLVHPYLQPPGTAYDESRNLINNNVHTGLVAGAEVQPLIGFPNSGSSTRNQGTSIANNPIVIDSDDSSEETISDDHNIHS